MRDDQVVRAPLQAVEARVVGRDAHGRDLRRRLRAGPAPRSRRRRNRSRRGSRSLPCTEAAAGCRGRAGLRRHLAHEQAAVGAGKLTRPTDAPLTQASTVCSCAEYPATRMRTGTMPERPPGRPADRTSPVTWSYSIGPVASRRDQQVPEPGVRVLRRVGHEETVSCSTLRKPGSRRSAERVSGHRSRQHALLARPRRRSCPCTPCEGAGLEDERIRPSIREPVPPPWVARRRRAAPGDREPGGRPFACRSAPRHRDPARVVHLDLHGPGEGRPRAGRRRGFRTSAADPAAWPRRPAPDGDCSPVRVSTRPASARRASTRSRRAQPLVAQGERSHEVARPRSSISSIKTKWVVTGSVRRAIEERQHGIGTRRPRWEWS